MRFSGRQAVSSETVCTGLLRAFPGHETVGFLISGGTLGVVSGGSASGVVFSGGGLPQVDSGGHVSGTMSGFHLGDEIDLRGLAYNSGSSTVTWTQKTSGANASGTLTIKEGTQTQSFTLIGTYTTSNLCRRRLHRPSKPVPRQRKPPRSPRR
jgi:hypothetical protein